MWLSNAASAWQPDMVAPAWGRCGRAAWAAVAASLAASRPARGAAGARGCRRRCGGQTGTAPARPCAPACNLWGSVSKTQSVSNGWASAQRSCERSGKSSISGEYKDAEEYCLRLLKQLKSLHVFKNLHLLKKLDQENPHFQKSVEIGTSHCSATQLLQHKVDVASLRHKYRGGLGVY